ncbi:hypothetical protein [Rhizobium sp. FKL33]|uniref:hypothetical protein n=1 Tax=Rhizobium sp. FKL33 TaxID=2562307 RepID=UPI0010C029B1|nr:hypothetical protein [Rhizobium sp. FKL33]
MRITATVTMIALACSLTACADNDARFGKIIQDGSTDPQLIARAESRCVKRTKLWSITLKTNQAVFLRTSVDKLPETVCGRMARAVRNGQLTGADVVSLLRDGRYTPAMLAAMREG